MVRSSGYFKEIGDAFSGMPDQDELELVYESPAGHSVLYKGHLSERIVIFKCLKPEFRGDEVHEAILRHEYKLAHPLKHPGVCDYLAWVRTPELGNCMVLEWVDGCTLAEWAAQGAWDETAAKSIILQLCDALSYIHRKQVLHNDLKPENVMVTSRDAIVKIIDFSLADSPSMTGGHLPAGTAGYSAPEVVAGGDASVRSDIFSLGRIIQEILPSRLDVSDRCLKDNPSERFSSADEVKAALESGRRKRGTILPAVIVLLAVLLAAWSFWRRPEKASLPADSGLFREALSLVREATDTTRTPDAAGYRFTDTLDCLNGRFIVACPQGYGMMDNDGRLLLEPVWDDIEFLSPDVALLTRNALSYLCSSEGRIFAESTDRETLSSSFQEGYERMLFEDMRRWDLVLDRLDSLCGSCLSPQGEAGSAAIFERTKESLHAVSGKMTHSQAIRLNEIEERFQNHPGR
ncbi:MAG: serine/threonine protein kinase [Bacteroidales bacterium]|nr:serine/threonine protein kinase [Bacteroidales bacterium]